MTAVSAAQRNGQPLTIEADYYVAAMPVEIMSALVTGPAEGSGPFARRIEQSQGPVDERHPVLPGGRCPPLIRDTRCTPIRRGP